MAETVLAARVPSPDALARASPGPRKLFSMKTGSPPGRLAWTGTGFERNTHWARSANGSA